MKLFLPLTVEMCTSGGGNLHVITVVRGFGMSNVLTYFPKDYEKEIEAKMMGRLKVFASENTPDSVPVQHIIGSGNVYE